MSRIDDIYNHAQVSEKALERYLVTEVERRGGLCLKYDSSSSVGYPDRIVILPSFPAAWVEVKSKGKKPRPIQEVRHSQLRNLGQRVYVVDSREGINAALNNIIGI